MQFTLPEDRFWKVVGGDGGYERPASPARPQAVAEAVAAGSTVEVAPRSFAVLEREE
jgi:hypothetical protein